MARPKSVFSKDLATRALADLDTLGSDKIALKLQAIIAATKYSISSVAEILGVSPETIWRWATAYRENGMDGLHPKTRKPKPSKLTSEQKAKVLFWLDSEQSAKGENVHWTLERLRHAISEEFGITLGINTIWVWLRKEDRRLRVPRPRHYEADSQSQKAF